MREGQNPLLWSFVREAKKWPKMAFLWVSTQEGALGGPEGVWDPLRDLLGASRGGLVMGPKKAPIWVKNDPKMALSTQNLVKKSTFSLEITDFIRISSTKSDFSEISETASSRMQFHNPLTISLILQIGRRLPHKIGNGRRDSGGIPFSQLQVTKPYRNLRFVIPSTTNDITS